MILDAVMLIWLHWNDLTAENTEDTEGENRDFNNSDATDASYPTGTASPNAPSWLNHLTVQPELRLN